MRQIKNRFAAYLQEQSGLSLIEVLVFITVGMFFFIAAISTTTTMIRNTQINEHKVIATRFAEELVEWLRVEKEEDWDTFSQKASGSPGTAYCFSTELSNSWPNADQECLFEATVGSNLQKYKREAVLTKQSSGEVTIKVVASWKELGQIFQVPISTVVTSEQ